MDACDSREQRDLRWEVIQALLKHIQSRDGLIQTLIHLRSTKSLTGKQSQEAVSHKS